MSDEPKRGTGNDLPSGDPWTRLPSMAPAPPSGAPPRTRPDPRRPGRRRARPARRADRRAQPARPRRLARPARDPPDPARGVPLTYDPLLRAWVLSRYADVATALTDARFTHGHRPGDPPCARAHVDVDIEALRAVTERTAYVLARRIAERPQADLVADFCHWLPAGTVAAAVGVPYRDMMRLVRGRAAGALAGSAAARSPYGRRRSPPSSATSSPTPTRSPPSATRPPAWSPGPGPSRCAGTRPCRSPCAAPPPRCR
ncbi:hypothetical protein O1L60_30050 [Streptomyces diastatochromogenes]|nr:hypothetical protein [Streptomyces diastatochromogenes]